MFQFIALRLSGSFFCAASHYASEDGCPGADTGQRRSVNAAIRPYTPSKILFQDLDNRLGRKLVYGGDGYLIAELAATAQLEVDDEDFCSFLATVRNLCSPAYSGFAS
jgi:hypothetical protein